MSGEAQVDVEYVRVVGEDVRARLFPEPKRMTAPDGSSVEGPRPVSQPVGVHYDPYGDGRVREVIFLAERSVQWVDSPPQEDLTGRVRVLYEGDEFAVAMTYGEEPTYGESPNVTVPYLVDKYEDEGVALLSLVAAVAGAF